MAEHCIVYFQYSLIQTDSSFPSHVLVPTNTLNAVFPLQTLTEPVCHQMLGIFFSVCSFLWTKQRSFFLKAAAGCDSERG